MNIRMDWQNPKAWQQEQSQDVCSSIRPFWTPYCKIQSPAQHETEDMQLEESCLWVPGERRFEQEGRRGKEEEDENLMHSWHRNGGQLRLLRRNCRTSNNTRSLEAIAAVKVSIDGVSVEHLGSSNRCRETGSQHDRRRRRGPCDVHNRRRRTCCAWWRQWLIILRDIRVRVPVIDVPRVAIH